MSEKSLEELLEMVKNFQPDWPYRLEVLEKLNAVRREHQGSLEGLATAAIAWAKNEEELAEDTYPGYGVFALSGKPYRSPEYVALFEIANKLRALKVKIIELQNEVERCGIILRGRCDG